MDLTVEDTGGGINIKNHEKLFDVFFQAGGISNRKAGGTGLGLPIARRIARLHSGDLRFIAGGGSRTRFVLTLPLKIKHEDTPTAPMV